MVFQVRSPSVLEFLWLSSNTTTKSNLGRRGFTVLTLPHHSSLLKDGSSNRAGIWRWGRMQRPRKKAAHWLAQPAAFYSTQDHQPRTGTSHGELDPTHQLSVQKSKTLASVGRTFTNGGFLPHSDYSLCQGDKTSRKPTRH